MSGLSHTPGKRARGKTLRGFESRLLRQKLKRKRTPGVRFFASTECYLSVRTICMADAIRLETSVILPGTMSVVLASAATRL